MAQLPLHISGRFFFGRAVINDRFQFPRQMEWMARRAISGSTETKETSPTLLC
jgi:hypothetical protein